MSIWSGLAAVLLLTAAASADDSGARSKLTGNWRLVDDSGKDSNTVWILEGENDEIQITESRNNEVVAKFSCNTMGRECAVKESGQKAKISLYYNGPSLVEMEIRGNDVVKRRFTATDSGDKLEIEVIPIAPSGKTEVLRLRRTEATAARN